MADLHSSANGSSAATEAAPPPPNSSHRDGSLVERTEALSLAHTGEHEPAAGDGGDLASAANVEVEAGATVAPGSDPGPGQAPDLGQVPAPPEKPTDDIPALGHSTQNLYLQGLPADCTDEMLLSMCHGFGKIVSAKAITRSSQKGSMCRGYGFVFFEQPEDASRAVESLLANGIAVSFAKVPKPSQKGQQREQPEQERPPPPPRPPREQRGHREHRGHEDPTNLYFSNLPIKMTETHLEEVLLPYGRAVSTRILHAASGVSRGVGFARMQSNEICRAVIQAFDGFVFQGESKPVLCKFANLPKRVKGSRRGHDLRFNGPPPMMFASLPQQQPYGYVTGMYPQMPDSGPELAGMPRIGQHAGGGMLMPTYPTGPMYGQPVPYGYMHGYAAQPGAPSSLPVSAGLIPGMPLPGQGTSRTAATAVPPPLPAGAPGDADATGRGGPPPPGSAGWSSGAAMGRGMASFGGSPPGHYPGMPPLTFVPSSPAGPWDAAHQVPAEMHAGATLGPNVDLPPDAPQGTSLDAVDVPPLSASGTHEAPAATQPEW